MTVAAIVDGSDGTGALALAVASSLAVGAALSLELTHLLAAGDRRPARRLRGALPDVREGDYSVRLPVVTSDELGELTADFNRWPTAWPSASGSARRSGPTWITTSPG